MSDDHATWVERALAQQLHLRHQLVRGLGGALATSDLTVPQLRLLNEVDAAGATTVLDLAAALGVTPSTVTISVERLVRRGVISRVEDSADRRRKRITVTVEGKTLLDAIDEGGLDHLRRTLPHLTTDELRDLVRVFDRLGQIDEGLGPMAD